MGCEKKFIMRGPYNCCGDTAWEIEIGALGRNWSFIRALRKDAPKDGACTNGRFVYTINRKRSKSGHAKQGAYIYIIDED